MNHLSGSLNVNLWLYKHHLNAVLVDPMYFQAWVLAMFTLVVDFWLAPGLRVLLLPPVFLGLPPVPLSWWHAGTAMQLLLLPLDFIVVIYDCMIGASVAVGDVDTVDINVECGFSWCIWCQHDHLKCFCRCHCLSRRRYCSMIHCCH